MVFNNATTTRWKEDDSNKWTEVVSKKKQYQQQQQQLQQQLQQQQQQQQQQHGVDDPFAGMKSCVDYEQEIERLKQLVPKVPADSQHKKRPSLEKKFNTNTNTNTTSNTATSTAPTSNHTSNNHNFLNNEFINTNNTTSTIASPTSTTPTTTSTSNATNNPTSAASTISRSNSPDTTHSSDSDVSSVLSDHQIVTEEEKLRFLAFVRSWTGDWRKGAMMDDLTSSSNSLWADQSPWSRRHNVQSQQYYSYQQPTMLNKHGQQPIGMGRKTHHHQQSFGYAL